MTRKPTTRSHGEGSIYRSDYARVGGVAVERWIASVDLGIGADGKRRRKKITGPTRKAVADKLREAVEVLRQRRPHHQALGLEPDIRLCHARASL